MYTSEQRVRFPGMCTGDYNAPFARFYQETYSWRTGRRSEGGFGNHVVQPPPRIDSGAPLGDKLRARRKYIEDMGSNLVAQNAGTPKSTAPSRFLTHDTGHNFSSVKYTHTGSLVMRRLRFNTGAVNGFTGLPFFTTNLEVPQGVVLKLNPNFTSKARITNQNGTSSDITIGPSSAQQAKDSTALFSAARPDASVAGWGETIVELLSGNLPKVVTRLGRNIASGRFMHKSYKGNLKDLSDDYLNQLFGWSPIIRDLEATVRHLLQLHAFLYDNSYRRHRGSPKKVESRFSAVFATGVPGIIPGYSSLGIAYGDVSLAKRGHTFTQTYDTRLSARFTRARPSSSANSFADKGLLILQELGVGYPSLAWDLIPYSFLVDWVVSLGKGIDNYSTYSRSSGSFLTDYAYATTKVAVHRTAPAGFSRAILTSSGKPSVQLDTRWTNTQQSTVSTVRSTATPFGFGITLPTLTSSQYAILVALGLARSR